MGLLQIAAIVFAVNFAAAAWKGWRGAVACLLGVIGLGVICWGAASAWFYVQGGPSSAEYKDTFGAGLLLLFMLAQLWLMFGSFGALIGLLVAAFRKQPAQFR